MLTPEYLASASEYLVRLYDDLEESIIQDIARRIPVDLQKIADGLVIDQAVAAVSQIDRREFKDRIAYRKGIHVDEDGLVVGVVDIVGMVIAMDHPIALRHIVDQLVKLVVGL